jgi:hypothetical protein
VSYAGVRQVSVSGHPKPRVKNPTDVIEDVGAAVTGAPSLAKS